MMKKNNEKKKKNLQGLIKRSWISYPNNNEKSRNTNIKKQYPWKKIFFRILLIILNVTVLAGFIYLFFIDWNTFSPDPLVINAKEKLMRYKNIWDTRQWIVSLSGLFILYAALIVLLNWTGLTRPITWWEGFLLISFDLMLNFIVGLIYMGFHDTIIGGLMLQCPIALSPFILAIELTVYALYVFWGKNHL